MRLSAFSLLVPDYGAGIAFFCAGLGFSLTEDIDQDAIIRWVSHLEPGAVQNLRNSSVIVSRSIRMPLNQDAGQT